jgi:hypothetical protein
MAATSVGITGPQRRVELVAVTSPQTCTHAAVPSCSFPDHIRRRDVAARLAQQMWAPLSGAGRQTPGGIIEDRLARPDNWISVNLWAADAESTATELARGTTAWQLCGRDHVTQRAMGVGANQRVAWLLSQLDDPSNPQPARNSIATILKLPVDQQVEWWYQRPADTACA